MRVAIVDYGSGNLRSVTNALTHLGASAQVTERAADLEQADALVLPGQGAFGDAMSGLERRGLIVVLRALAQAGKPILGICIGLQILFQRSDESPGVAGLGILTGAVRRLSGPAFQPPDRLKIPHMGWNGLRFVNPHPLFAGLEEGCSVYFIHSYCPAPSESRDEWARSEYGGLFCASAGRGNVAGCLFHPEKSQTAGLRILKNFLAWRP